METASQATRLRGIGCDTGQGWLYSRPVAPNELFFALLTASSSDGELVDSEFLTADETLVRVRQPVRVRDQFVRERRRTSPPWALPMSISSPFGAGALLEAVEAGADLVRGAVDDVGVPGVDELRSIGLKSYASASSGVGTRPGRPVRRRTMFRAAALTWRRASFSSSVARAETPIRAYGASSTALGRKDSR